MKSINYISHLNRVFYMFSSDNRPNTTHVSMYMALFHFWNRALFADEFYINRNEVMQLSKIGSKGTYHKCMKDLDAWQYLKYLPSRNPQIGSKINMFDFGTSTEQVEVHHSTKSGTSIEQVEVRQSAKSGTSIEQVVVRQRTKSGTSTVQVPGRYINNIKHNKHINLYKPKNLKNVIDFFISKKWHTYQAAKFFNHYESVGWKKGKSQIENWQAAAESWMIQAEALNNSKAALETSKDSLHTIRNKNYNQPL